MGTQASHLKGEFDQNAPIYNPALSLAENRATIDERRPIVGFSRIDRFFHGLNSVYNGHQISVDKRYGHGFTILGSYTWSKALDFHSNNQAAQDAPLSYPFKFSLDRGPANQNRPQRLVASLVWGRGARILNTGITNPSFGMLTGTDGDRGFFSSP